MASNPNINLSTARHSQRYGPEGLGPKGGHNIDPNQAIMVEDMARNLAPAHEMGMTCVWVTSDNDWAKAGHDGDHVHHVVSDLTQWLEIVSEP